MKCGFCGVVILDDRVTIEGVPACNKCVVKGVVGCVERNDKP
jgi:hypothetical protein